MTAASTALLRVRVRCLVNQFRKGSAADRRRLRSALIATVVLGGMVAYLAAQVGVPITRAISGLPGGSLVIARLPAMLMLPVFGFLVLSAVPSAIQLFYLAPEISLELAAPIPFGQIFAARAIEAVLRNGALVVPCGLVGAAAYHWGDPGSVLACIPGALVALVLFVATPTLAGIVGAALMMRFLPAGRTRDLLGAITLTLVAVAYYAISMTIRHAGQDGSAHRQAAQVAGAAANPVYSHGPWAWAGAMVAGAGAGASALALMSLLVPVVLAAIVGYLVTRSVHLQGWRSSQEAGKRPAVPGRRLPTSATSFLPGPVRAYLVKGILELGRDMRRLSSVLMPVAAIAVYLAGLRDMGDMGRASGFLLVLGLLPILAAATLRVSMTSFLVEEQTLWISLGAPCDAALMVTGKYLLTLVVALPLGIVATEAYVHLRRLPPEPHLAAIGLALCATVAFAGIGVGAAACGLRNPAETMRVPSMGTRAGAFALEFGYIVLVALLMAAGWLASVPGVVPMVVIQMVTGLLVVALSSAVAVAGIKIGARHIRRMEC